MSGDDLLAVPIDRDNLESFLRLSVSPEQEKFVANNAVSVAQGCFADGAVMHGLLWQGEAAGFYSVINPALSSEDPGGFLPDCAHLWRFMIDQRFQGKGLGGRALAQIFDAALAEGFNGVSLTAVKDAPGCPIPFYKKHGFALTGRLIEGEVELVKRARS